VSQHLRNILLVPLSAWDFGAAVNLFDGWFYRPRANRTNLFCLVVLVVDDAVTVLVEVVDKILSLFLVQSANRAFAASTCPCQSKVSACLKRFNDPPTLCKFSIKIPIENFPTFTVSNFVDDVPTPSCPSLNRWLVRQAVGGWPTQGIVVLEICPDSLKVTCKAFLPSAGFLGVRMRIYPIHAQLFDKLLNLWHLKGLTMH